MLEFIGDIAFFSVIPLIVFFGALLIVFGNTLVQAELPNCPICANGPLYEYCVFIIEGGECLDSYCTSIEIGCCGLIGCIM